MDKYHYAKNWVYADGPNRQFQRFEQNQLQDATQKQP